ncbi:MAG: hypothetical protein WBA89_28780 [Microcoleus sp.]|uniref:hypothetical protein n=1 Tax=Microcoleus sp. TaxID=44472 RepID=UPI003C70679F
MAERNADNLGCEIEDFWRSGFTGLSPKKPGFLTKNLKFKVISRQETRFLARVRFR